MAKGSRRPGYQGDPSKARGMSAKQATAAAKKQKKKTRGPAKLVPLPNGAGKKDKGKGKLEEDGMGSGSGEDGEEEEEEYDSEANHAEDMVGDGASSDDGSEEEGPRAAHAESSSKPDVRFLTSLDVNAISTSRAEEKRLKKEEKKRLASELKALGKLSKKRAPSAPTGKDESGSEDYDFDEEDDLELSDSPMDSEDADSELLDSDNVDSEADLDLDSELDSELEDDDSEAESLDAGEAEDRLAQRVAAQAKRKRMEEEVQSAQKSKKARLPVRGENGWHKDTNESGEESDGARAAQGDIPKAGRVLRPVPAADDLESEDEPEPEEAPQEPKSSVATGSRFGLLAPYKVMQIQPRAYRLAAAREQIAQLAQNIISDPEVAGLGFLRRMAVFARMKIPRPSHVEEESGAPAGAKKKAKSAGADEEAEEDGPDALPVDLSIRAAAILSLMAVYSDILPGYRIRPLTEAEQAEKVSQEVQRRRDFEQGIIAVYREFLELCEKQIQAKHELAPIALKAMTTLLLRAPQFNYRTNIIRTVVARLSRAGWNDDSSLCASTLVQILREDSDGETSLEVVRLLHRMTKERRYKVNAAVLDILLHLRLKDELGDKRASTTQATRSKPETYDKKAKPSEVRKKEGQHLSKAQVKKMREMKEIEKDMREAEATVDLEQRERNHTETLKLLFVLYFAILKSETASSALLGSALEGLAMFAHRINVDFFRDLLAVLREHVHRARRQSSEHDPREAVAAEGEEQRTATRRDIRDALLCLVTAFELLSGQGEALNIDLSDMASQLYSVMLEMSMSAGMEEAPERSTLSANGRKTTHLRSSADLLFRALELLLLRPRASTVSSERAAAFSKRLLSCCLHWPATSVIRSVRMIKVMVARDVRLIALFDGEDLARDGKFDPSSDNVDAVRPLACGESAWELEVLKKSCNADVRAEVAHLVAAVADGIK